jgi:hypothetical protein
LGAVTNEIENFLAGPAYEHIYCDQASLLVRVGLPDPGRLPVVGNAQARAVVDASVPMNEVISALPS